MADGLTPFPHSGPDPKPKGSQKPAPLDRLKPENAILANMSDDQYRALSPDQRESIQGYMRSMQFGVIGVAPMNCKGAGTPTQDGVRDACPFLTKCPLHQANVELPVGKSCPVEQGLLQTWFDQYCMGAGIDMADMEEHAYDLLLIADLANYQLMEARGAMELSDNPMINTKHFVGYDSQGTAIYSNEMNKVLTFVEKIAKTKIKLMRELITTRKAKSEDVKNYSRNRTSQAQEILVRAKVKQAEQSDDSDE